MSEKRIDPKRQDTIIAIARAAQAFEDADRVLDNVMVQAGLADLYGIANGAAEMKKQIARWRHMMFTGYLPPLYGTQAGNEFALAQEKEEEP